jgi:hypothetical protein
VSKRKPLGSLQSIRDVLLLAFSTSSSAAFAPVYQSSRREAWRQAVHLPVRHPAWSDHQHERHSPVPERRSGLPGTGIRDRTKLWCIAAVDDNRGGLPSEPSTPGVGIVILALILTSAGIPTTGIALIIGVDRILDMSRTAVNVMGDLVTCLVMDKWIGGKRTAREEVMEAEMEEKQKRDRGEDVIVS